MNFFELDFAASKSLGTVAAEPMRPLEIVATGSMMPLGIVRGPVLFVVIVVADLGSRWISQSRLARLGRQQRLVCFCVRERMARKKILGAGCIRHQELDNQEQAFLEPSG